uniref:Endonuclease/exonuclease/phosphatase domain-containing protein n=1 Tax=Chromera velia CCMP2878 TaxID=1169474 RepID=A0A0G4F7E1_9ALVE|eukprot:Cvel_15502.t1-p1 / transcript=Cvel_15502.t1 / gene=Cvel_15502 / organism=Chromera_velia_CCMP2878 / gene_product=Craniofacial development protein 2, putative / transcript_product=Craniofacial development protein 2, putative / location=Cvel_scaffold1150:32737-41778(+) / protein_length=1542 / sequence_SO=supercontig / SO=protein_coding / is_pseudo=false
MASSLTGLPKRRRDRTPACGRGGLREKHLKEKELNVNASRLRLGPLLTFAKLREKDHLWEILFSLRCVSLNLSGNEIKEVNLSGCSADSVFTKVRTYDLSFNRLSTFDGKLHPGFGSVLKLDLSNNCLRSVKNLHLLGSLETKLHHIVVEEGYPMLDWRVLSFLLLSAPSLEEVNGERVTAEKRENVRERVSSSSSEAGRQILLFVRDCISAMSSNSPKLVDSLQEYDPLFSVHNKLSLVLNERPWLVNSREYAAYKKTATAHPLDVRTFSPVRLRHGESRAPFPFLSGWRADLEEVQELPETEQQRERERRAREEAEALERAERERLEEIEREERIKKEQEENERRQKLARKPSALAGTRQRSLNANGSQGKGSVRIQAVRSSTLGGLTDSAAPRTSRSASTLAALLQPDDPPLSVAEEHNQQESTRAVRRQPSRASTTLTLGKDAQESSPQVRSVRALSISRRPSQSSIKSSTNRQPSMSQPGGEEKNGRDQERPWKENMAADFYGKDKPSPKGTTAKARNNRYRSMPALFGQQNPFPPQSIQERPEETSSPGASPLGGPSSSPPLPANMKQTGLASAPYASSAKRHTVAAVTASRNPSFCHMPSGIPGDTNNPVGFGGEADGASQRHQIDQKDPLSFAFFPPSRKNSTAARPAPPPFRKPSLANSAVHFNEVAEEERGEKQKDEAAAQEASRRLSTMSSRSRTFTDNLGMENNDNRVEEHLAQTPNDQEEVVEEETKIQTFEERLRKRIGSMEELQVDMKERALERRAEATRSVLRETKLLSSLRKERARMYAEWLGELASRRPSSKLPFQERRHGVMTVGNLLRSRHRVPILPWAKEVSHASSSIAAYREKTEAIRLASLSLSSQQFSLSLSVGASDRYPLLKALMATEEDRGGECEEVFEGFLKETTTGEFEFLEQVVGGGLGTSSRNKNKNKITAPTEASLGLLGGEGESTEGPLKKQGTKQSFRFGRSPSLCSAKSGKSLLDFGALSSAHSAEDDLSGVPVGEGEFQQAQGGDGIGRQRPRGPSFLRQGPIAYQSEDVYLQPGSLPGRPSNNLGGPSPSVPPRRASLADSSLGVPSLSPPVRSSSAWREKRRERRKQELRESLADHEQGPRQRYIRSKRFTDSRSSVGRSATAAQMAMSICAHSAAASGGRGRSRSIPRDETRIHRETECHERQRLLLAGPPAGSALQGRNGVGFSFSRKAERQKPGVLQQAGNASRIGGAGDEEVAEFYRDLGEAVRKVPNGNPVIIGGDFNARVGERNEETAVVLGRFMEGQRYPNRNGQCLLEFCLEHELVVANSFFQHPLHHKGSWQHPRSKKWHELDYFLVKRRDLSRVCDVRVFRSIDCWSDHRFLPKVTAAATAEQLWEETAITIRSVAEATTEDKGIRPAPEWFAETCSQLLPLLEHKRKARVVYENASRKGETGVESKRREYVRARNAAAQAVRRARNAWWSQKGRELEEAFASNNFSKLHRFWKELQRPQGRPGINAILGEGQKAGDPPLTDAGEVRARFGRFFEGVLNLPSQAVKGVTDRIPQA